MDTHTSNQLRALQFIQNDLGRTVMALQSPSQRLQQAQYRLIEAVGWITQEILHLKAENKIVETAKQAIPVGDLR